MLLLLILVLSSSADDGQTNFFLSKVKNQQNGSSVFSVSKESIRTTEVGDYIVNTEIFKLSEHGHVLNILLKTVIDKSFKVKKITREIFRTDTLEEQQEFLVKKNSVVFTIKKNGEKKKAYQKSAPEDFVSFNAVGLKIRHGKLGEKKKRFDLYSVNHEAISLEENKIQRLFFEKRDKYLWIAGKKCQQFFYYFEIDPTMQIEAYIDNDGYFCKELNSQLGFENLSISEMEYLNYKKDLFEKSKKESAENAETKQP